MDDLNLMRDCLEYLLIGGGAMAALHMYFSLERGAKRNKVYTIGEEERRNLSLIEQDLDERLEQIRQYPTLRGRPQSNALVMARTTLRCTDYRNEDYVTPDMLDYVFEVCRRWHVAERHLPKEN